MSSLHSPVYESLMPLCEDGVQRSSLIKRKFFLVSERQTRNKCINARLFAIVVDFVAIL